MSQNKAQKQNKHTNGEQNGKQTRTGNNVKNVAMNVSTPDTSPDVFRCPECGKTFKSEKSLRGHMLVKHKIPWKKSETKPGAPGVTPAGKPKVTPKVLPEAGVPDAYTLLYNQLVLYGLRPQDANAVVDFMKNYNVDDLYALNKALNDIGMPRNRKKLFLESWINARGLRITPELAKELDLFDEHQVSSRTPYDWRRTFHFGESRPEPPKEDIRDKLLLEAFRKLTSNQGNNNIGQLIMTFQQQIDALRKELDQERQKRIEERIKHLEEQLKEKEKHVGNVELKKLDILDRKFTELLNLIKAMGSVPISPPKREKVESETSIYDFLPEDLVISEVNESE